MYFFILVLIEIFLKVCISILVSDFLCCNFVFLYCKIVFLCKSVLLDLSIFEYEIGLSLCFLFFELSILLYFSLVLVKILKIFFKLGLLKVILFKYFLILFDNLWLNEFKVLLIIFLYDLSFILFIYNFNLFVFLKNLLIFELYFLFNFLLVELNLRVIFWVCGLVKLILVLLEI